MNRLTDETLINGTCKDFAEYKKVVGIIEGLAIAERELLDLEARTES